MNGGRELSRGAARTPAREADGVPQAAAGRRAPRAGAAGRSSRSSRARRATERSGRTVTAVEALAGHLRTPDVHATVVEDSEHQAFARGPRGPNGRVCAAAPARSRFRDDRRVPHCWRAAYQDVRDLMVGPVTIRTGASFARRRAGRRSTRTAGEGVPRRPRRADDEGHAARSRSRVTRSTSSWSSSSPPAAAASP